MIFIIFLVWIRDVERQDLKVLGAPYPQGKTNIGYTRSSFCRPVLQFLKMNTWATVDGQSTFIRE